MGQYKNELEVFLANQVIWTNLETLILMNFFLGHQTSWGGRPRRDNNTDRNRKEYCKDYLYATSVHICIWERWICKHFTIFYSPRYNISETQVAVFFSKLVKRFLAAGAYSTKHSLLLISPKDRNFYNPIQNSGRDF